MDLSQKLTAHQGMRQEQQMSHQQIQALEMLTTPLLEIETLIAAEMEKNPLLEVERPDEPAPAEKAEESPERDDPDEWLEQLINLEERHPAHLGTGSNYSSDDEEKREHFFNSLTREVSLQEELLNQLFFLDLDKDGRELCELIINTLNDDGYLGSHPADLAMASGKPLEVVKVAVKLVQSLDPAGVAAIDLKDRLLIQLLRRGFDKHSPVYQVVERHLDDLAHNRLPQIAKNLRIGMDQLHDAIETIHSLQPRITTSNHEAPAEYVCEEMTIAEDEDGELVLTLHNNYLPSLSISNRYREMLKDPSTPQETKEYIRDKVRAAGFLISSIEQRQNTVEKIARSLMAHQEEFFKYGKDRMKPLTMAEVAEEIGVHETTISRGVSGKYLRCKYGLFALKYFFTAGYTAEDGDAVSNVAVKERIRVLIEQEDSKKPLSDDKISKILKDEGLNVARRTVAKYRESMKIPASKMRRTYWTKA